MRQIIYGILSYFDIISKGDVSQVNNILNVKLPPLLVETQEAYSLFWSYWIHNTNIIDNKINGKRHSLNDKPAAIDANGTQYWYQNGKWHRDHDKPAIIRADGSQLWYQNGEKHRDNDKPAVIYAD